MGRWALGLLIVSMALWTSMTAFAGWYAWQGTAGSSAVAAESVSGTLDTSAPGRVREVRALKPEEVRLITEGMQPPAETAAALPTAAVPTAAARGAARPVPKYVESAGVDRRVRPADTGTPHRTTRAASKGMIVLDPGHGRGDPGAVHHVKGTGRVDVTEAESNLRNALLIRDELVAMGYDVYLTREDAGRGPGVPLARQFIVSDLYARVALAKAVEADAYLAIHGNGASVTSISGPETWYCGKHQEGEWNRRLAMLAQQAMIDALTEYGYAPPDRGIKEDALSHHSGEFCQFVVTRETPVPAALIEFLFLSNDADAAVLADDRSHQILARHVAQALDAFMQERREAGYQ